MVKKIVNVISRLFIDKKECPKIEVTRKICTCNHYIAKSKNGRFADSTCANCGGKQPDYYYDNSGESSYFKGPAIGE